MTSENRIQTDRYYDKNFGILFCVSFYAVQLKKKKNKKSIN